VPISVSVLYKLLLQKTTFHGRVFKLCTFISTNPECHKPIIHTHKYIRLYKY